MAFDERGGLCFLLGPRFAPQLSPRHDLLDPEGTGKRVAFDEPVAVADAVAVAASFGKLPTLRRSHHYGTMITQTARYSSGHPTKQTSWQTSTAAEITPLQ